MGQHTDAVRCMEFCTTKRLVVSGGWDNHIKVRKRKKFHENPLKLLALGYSRLNAS
jgi:WD40 repeat protein